MRDLDLEILSGIRSLPKSKRLVVSPYRNAASTVSVCTAPETISSLLPSDIDEALRERSWLRIRGWGAVNQGRDIAKANIDRRISGFDPPPASVFTGCVVELKEHGVSEAEAMAVADVCTHICIVVKMWIPSSRCKLETCVFTFHNSSTAGQPAR